jgi:hypothetical protein
MTPRAPLRTPEADEKIVLKLFSIFDQLWPMLWAKQFETFRNPCMEDEDVEKIGKVRKEGILTTWKMIVFQIPDGALGRTVEALKTGKTKHIKYPPTPLEFLELGKSYTGSRFDQKKVDSYKKCPKEIAYRYLNEMFALSGRTKRYEV